MKLKWLLNTAVISLLIILAFIGLADHDKVVAAQDADSKIEGVLQDRFTVDGNADFIVRFVDQADLSAAYSMNWDERGEFVYNTLRETAERSQVNAKAILDASGLKYQTFFTGNDLYVWSGSLINATALAELPEVYYVRAVQTYHVDPIEKTSAFDNISWAGDYLLNNALTSVGASPQSVAWGLTDTGATSFWTNYGVRGDGMVVANIDTGVDYTHAALDQSYKCAANPSSLDCWYDPGVKDCTGPNGGPCDTIYAGIYHGTHTMGTMVGDDDPLLTNEVGMAPNAQWIACLGLPFGSGTDLELNACADWIVAPNGNPANRPDVVNNSWGDTPDGNNWYLAKVNAWRAAGIFPAFSAGNSGSSCDTMGDPGSYQESFASAAHDITRTIASFSSRGPSAFGHTPYTKPNISAPGVNVLSTAPGNAWVNMSGTSMASPHVAGAVALLWSCNPSLVGQIDATFQVLQNNSDPAPAGNCSAPPDGQGNYTYGYGYLNVNTAGAATCGGLALGTLEGHVYDTSGTPLVGATVTASAAVQNDQVNAITDPNGYYTMNLVVGTYNVTASKSGYSSQTVNGVVIEENVSVIQDFHLRFVGLWTQGPSMCFDLTRLDGEFYPGTGKAYFLGGRSGSSTIGTIYSFNPATGVCADTGADMPIPISNYTVNLVNDGSADMLCTFGGRDGTGATTRAVQCYNPNTNGVSTVAQLPAAWTGYTPGAQVVVNNLVYIFGGFNGLASPYVTARTDVYNPVTGIFNQLDDLNLARTYILATAVDGVIYAFGGDTYDGSSLVAQTIAEKFDPGIGSWNDAGVADLPIAGDEGVAFGFDTDSPYELAGQIVLASLAQWSGSSSTVIAYDVASNTYNVDFPDLLNARRNHAGVFIPLYTDNPADGLPGMWVFKGYFGSDNPPYAPTEFFPMIIPRYFHLPLIYK